MLKAVAADRAKMLEDTRNDLETWRGDCQEWRKEATHLMVKLKVNTGARGKHAETPL